MTFLLKFDDKQILVCLKFSNRKKISHSHALAKVHMIFVINELWCVLMADKGAF
jgi:hypothetical protein